MPVMKHMREGTQIGALTYARSKRMPRPAMRSRFGVRTSTPQPGVGVRCRQQVSAREAGVVSDGRGVLAGRRALVLGAGAPAGSAVAVALARSGSDVAVAAGSLDGDEVMAVRRAKRAVEAL